MAKDISYKQLFTHWPLYFFVLPSALMVATFAYFPAASAIYHSTFRWNGSDIKFYIGSANFDRALGSPILWVCLLVGTFCMILTSKKRTPFANGIKLFFGIGLPLINLAVLSQILDEWGPLDPQKGFIPAVIWITFWLLIKWGTESDNELRGVVNYAVYILGAGTVLTSMGFYPNTAWSINFLISGIVLWTLAGRKRILDKREGLRIFQAMGGMGLVVWSLALHAGGDATLWGGFAVISVLVVANLVKMVPSITTAVVINRLKSESANYWYRVMFVIPMIIPGIVMLLIWKFFFSARGLFNLVLRESGIMHLMYLFDYWTENGVFISAEQVSELSMNQVIAMADMASPTWLGSPDLVLPAFILWGFPWVGVVGVLIYLAGLQSIDQSIYEAADLDGVGAFGKFLNIELPLILTQVRINLVLMIIGTLQTYGMILILLGDAGGPNGKMMVPGLLMYRSAFVEGYSGYACSIGLILFFLILVLTEINNRFVRVEK